MEEKLYLNLARAEIICDFKNKIVNIEHLKYLHRQLQDNDLFIRLIFEIVKSLSIDNDYTSINEIITSEKYFIDEIILCIKKICNKDLDLNFYSHLWIYIIYINENNYFEEQIKGEYLKEISPSFYVDKYFMLEYYSVIMDNIMAISPINIEKLNEIKNKVKETMYKERN